MVDELRGFGLWFASGAFDEDWSLALLGRVLEVTRRIDSDLHVLRRLAALSATRPAAAMTYLIMLVEGDTEGWHVEVWREEATVISESARDSGDEGARRAARELINRLIAKGNRRFEALLEGL